MAKVKIEESFKSKVLKNYSLILKKLLFLTKNTMEELVIISIIPNKRAGMTISDDKRVDTIRVVTTAKSLIPIVIVEEIISLFVNE